MSTDLTGKTKSGRARLVAACMAGAVMMGAAMPALAAFAKPEWVLHKDGFSWVHGDWVNNGGPPVLGVKGMKNGPAVAGFSIRERNWHQGLINAMQSEADIQPLGYGGIVMRANEFKSRVLPATLCRFNKNGKYLYGYSYGRDGAVKPDGTLERGFNVAACTAFDPGNPKQPIAHAFPFEFLKAHTALLGWFAASGNGGKNGQNVAMYDCHGGSNQRWTYGGGDKIINRAAGQYNWCLDIKGGSKKDGANVQIWKCENVGQHRWAAVKK
jgi:hypothetical protein